MAKLTKYQACSETRDLWTGLADQLEKGEYYEKSEIPGPWEKYNNNCPCCQYARDIMEEIGSAEPDCNQCPMKPEWDSFKLQHTGTAYFCETYDTPFCRWENGPSELSCYDLEFFARMIVELAEDAMKRIKAEETP